MIAVAEDIFEEIETEVVLLNGEVVRRAFNGIERFEENICCGYIGHRNEFADLLDYYISLKADARRIQRRIDGKGEWREPWGSGEQGYDYAVKRVHDNTMMAADVRRRLKNHWPCVQCIRIYNPTKRKQPWLTKLEMW